MHSHWAMHYMVSCLKFVKGLNMLLFYFRVLCRLRLLLVQDIFSKNFQQIKMKGRDVMKKSEWILCPVCGNKTRNRVREDTILRNYPLYCPKCKQESLIDAKDLQVTVIKGLEAKTQS